MRIISGSHKGRRISPPNNLDVRPTTDKAKEALFNIINNKYFFTQKNMLDLFSGTGNIGFEFASRGTEKVITIDNNKKCIDFIKNTANKLQLNVFAVQSNAIKYTKNCKEKFNFIFADPPYNYQKHEELKEIIIDKKLVKDDGLLIIEHDKEKLFNDNNVEVRKYGAVHFSIFSF